MKSLVTIVLLAGVALLAYFGPGLLGSLGEEPDAVAQAGGGLSLAAKAESPQAFGSVPEFALVSQTGAAVRDEDLLGSPYVVAAVFTTCIGPCPRIAREMGRLQEALEDTDVRLVSISVDPGYDTPEILAEYAEALGAAEERWLFLTGEEDAVHALVREGFKLGVARADADVPFGMQVTHGTKLVAVDRSGRIRGWYESQSERGVDALLERMRFLAEEDHG